MAIPDRINLRKLAALDILFLGPRLIVAEFAFGVFFSVALGLFVLVRGHSFWQLLLGIYFLCLGINYVPMLVYAIAVGNKVNARKEMAGELDDPRKTMSKYRSQSLVLLVPLAGPILALTQKRS
jgi:membrane protein implicated in regulation of membrane protease activity